MSGTHSSRTFTVVGVLAALLALAAGWYVVSLGWSLAFLFGEGWLMAIYSLLLLISPALLTLLAIAAFQQKARVALWFVGALMVKWLVVFVYSFIQGGWDLLVVNLPIMNAITRLSDDFLTQYRLDQVVMLIIQFDLEFLVLALMAVMLVRGRG